MDRENTKKMEKNWLKDYTLMINFKKTVLINLKLKIIYILLKNIIKKSEIFKINILNSLQKFLMLMNLFKTSKIRKF